MTAAFIICAAAVVAGGIAQWAAAGRFRARLILFLAVVATVAIATTTAILTTDPEIAALRDGWRLAISQTAGDPLLVITVALLGCFIMLLFTLGDGEVGRAMVAGRCLAAILVAAFVGSGLTHAMLIRDGTLDEQATVAALRDGAPLRFESRQDALIVRDGAPGTVDIAGHVLPRPIRFAVAVPWAVAERGFAGVVAADVVIPGVVAALAERGVVAP